MRRLTAAGIYGRTIDASYLRGILPGDVPTYGTPTGDTDIGDANAEGSGEAATRIGHQHSFPAPAAGYPVDVALTEADGSATTPARADHRHAHGIGYLPDAHHNQAHDAGDHTNRTRSILLPPRVFGNTRGTLAIGVVSIPVADQVEVWLFDNAGALETIYTTILVPSDYVAETNFTFKLRWAASSTAAGNTRWYLTYTLVDVGETIDQAREAVLGVTSAAPETANTEVEASFPASSVGIVAGKRMALHLHRASHEAADTYEATAYMSALIIEYTADM